MSLTLEFAGTILEIDRHPYSIGREADFIVDDNRFLHRRFLTLTRENNFWILLNVGDRLTATVSDPDGRLEAFLAPGAVLPLVFEHTIVRFTAGPTSYELSLHTTQPAFRATPIGYEVGGTTTVGRVRLTDDQRRLVLALAEPALRGQGRSVSGLPSSAEAARRLGWTLTKFTRKLDNVCQKLTASGVRGLHGSPGNLAANRRARLVEYALAVRLVTAADLDLLDTPSETEADTDDD